MGDEMKANQIMIEDKNKWVENEAEKNIIRRLESEQKKKKTYSCMDVVGLADCRASGTSGIRSLAYMYATNEFTYTWRINGEIVFCVEFILHTKYN